ncbi:MAG: sigma-70 family RNA polymerase sigma factor [Niallia nealsonii]|nr:sigma-70 family RNA polymerase sigma factor [Niallia nealsonii]
MEEKIPNELTKDDLILYLINQYGLMVKKLAYSYVKDIGLAEDITQDVFLRCYNKLDDFKGNSQYKTWIYRITINRSKDVLKKEKYKIFLHNTKLVFSNTETPEHILIQHESYALVSEALFALPIKYKEVMYLYYYEELKIIEIQKLLNLKVGTIKTRLRRGRKLLKDTLEKGGDLFESKYSEDN